MSQLAVSRSNSQSQISNDSIIQEKDDLNDIIDKGLKNKIEEATSLDRMEQLKPAAPKTESTAHKVGRYLAGIFGGLLLAAGIAAATVATLASFGIAAGVTVAVASAVGGVLGSSIIAGCAGAAGIGLITTSALMKPKHPEALLPQNNSTDPEINPTRKNLISERWGTENNIIMDKLVTKDDVSNASLASASLGKNPLPNEYQAAVDSVLDDLRGKYGEKHIPRGATLKDLLHAVDEEIIDSAPYKMYTAIKDAPNAIRPNDLKRIIRDVYVPMLNVTVLAKIVEEKASQVGGLGGLSTSTMVSNLLKYQPGLQQKVNALKSEAEVRNLAEKLNVEQMITQLRRGLEGGIAELRSVYENELSLNLDEALSLKDEQDHTMASRLNGFYRGNGLVSPQQMTIKFKSILEPILKRKAVENALCQKAKEMGVPLTRRSTVLLAESLLNRPENAEALSRANGPTDLKNRISGMGIDDLLRAQKAGINNAFATHADKLTPEVRPLFRTFLEGCCFAPSSAAETNRIVNDMANHMKEWKNSDGSGESRKALNNYFKQVIGSDLEMLEGVPGNTDTTAYTDNIYGTLLADANRNQYSVNNEVIVMEQGTSQTQLTTKLKTLLPNARDQQFVSKLINQRLWLNVTALSSSGMLEDGSPVRELPGGMSIPTQFLGRSPLLVNYAGVTPTFALQVSDDRKTALVTASIGMKINHDDGMPVDGKMPHYGGIKFTFTIRLNLSANERGGQSVQDVKLAQEFIPRDQMNG